jgi:hypothetical protein
VRPEAVKAEVFEALFQKWVHVAGQIGSVGLLTQDLSTADNHLVLDGAVDDGVPRLRV